MITPVILDVNPKASSLDWERDVLTRIETPVIGCCGPDARGDCPQLRGEPCTKIEAADGVLFQLTRTVPPLFRGSFGSE